MEKGNIINLFCQQCSLQFDKMDAFEVHLSIVHKENFCKKDSQESDETEKTSDNELTGYFNCDACNFGFVTKKGLNWHVFSFHDGKKSIKSNPCEGTKNSDLKHQIASVHDGKNPFTCTICKECFAGKSLSEALILGSTNPQNKIRLFIDLPVQYMKTTSQNMLCT